MSDQASSATDTCYRHQDRQSYVLCQRCGRTICPECQTQAAVGFHCPECMKESRASSPRSRPRLLKSVRRVGTSGGSVVTYSLIGVTALVYLAQLLSGRYVEFQLAYFPELTASRPWTMITSIFVHSGSSFLHILFNMFSLFIFGRILEPAIGRWRFLALYLLSGLGGSVAVLLLNPGGAVLGASGAIFGLMGAFFIIQRGLGGNTTQLVVLVILNLAIGFVIPSIAWQAHVGGLIVGAAVGFAFLRTRGRQQKNRQLLYLGGILAALLVITVLAVNTLLP